MIKTKISNFIKKNKYKIQDLLTKLIIVAIIILIATIMLSSNANNNTNEDNSSKKINKPTQTVQKGKEVSGEQYKKDTNIVDKFVEYCNNKQIEEAYLLLSQSCKEKVYPTIEVFKNNYYNNIFKEKKEYNLQAWISTKNYTVYKIRYTNNIMATGVYDESSIYQDYITLLKDSEDEKISIGKFVMSNECNTKTITEEIETTIVKKNIYLEDEEYEIYITNKTENIILLDSLENNNNIKLITSDGVEYSSSINEVFVSNLTVNPGETKSIIIKFSKKCSSSKISEYIKFLNVIRNYEKYIENEEEYDEKFVLKINL